MSLSVLILEAIEQVDVAIPTPQLVAEFGYGRNNPRQNVWCALNTLERAGLIRREHRPRLTKRGGPSRLRIAYWSKA